MEEKIFKIKCPLCHTELWIDIVTKEVVKSERDKSRKKKDSLETLLQKEKKRIEGFDRKFEATLELQKAKKKQIEEQFKKAVSKVETEDSE
ncbi:MAG: hypothetical protein ACE5WD_09610 [Candidatus Aminicenantia bacterium]